MKIKCTNYECIRRDKKTKECTKRIVHMVTDHWNRHGVVCNDVKYAKVTK